MCRDVARPCGESPSPARSCIRAAACPVRRGELCLQPGLRGVLGVCRLSRAAWGAKTSVWDQRVTSPSAGSLWPAPVCACRPAGSCWTAQPADSEGLPWPPSCGREADGVWYGSTGAPGSSCVPILPARRGLSLTPPQSWNSLEGHPSAPALSRGDEPAGRRGAVGRTFPGLQDLGQTCGASQLLPPAPWRPAESDDKISAAGAASLEGQRTDGKRAVLQSARFPHGTAQVQRAALESLQGGPRCAVCGCVLTSVGTLAASVPGLGLPHLRALRAVWGRSCVLVVWLETSVVRTFVLLCALPGLES